VSLLALQRDMESWLTRESAEGLARYGESSRAGLAVYLNNYRSQLMSCLSSSYPAVRAVLGEADFDAAAAFHIDRVPPHDWTLDNYPRDFPSSLAELFPDRPHVEELARLELGLAMAFTGRDAESIPQAALSEVRWETAIIELLPTFTVIPVTTNVDVLLSAIRADQAPPPVELLARPMFLAIWRRQFTPRFRRVSAEEAAILAEVRSGRSFGGICAELVARLGEGPGTAAAAAMLGQWLSDGAIETVRS
jgi:hypothetical protein